MQEYQYWTLGAAGTIKLRESLIVTAAKSYRGCYEQSVPYAALNPMHGTLKTTPQGLFVAIGVACFLTVAGILAALGLATTPIQFIFYGSLAISGLYIFWLLRGFMVVEWAIFYTNDGGRGVAYPRNKDDSGKFEEFTESIIQRIEQSRMAFREASE